MHPSAHLVASAPDQLLPARELMASTLASHTILVPLGVALPLITLVMHYRGLLSLVVLVVITLFVTSEDAPNVRHGLTHGAGPAVGIAAGAASLLTAVLLVRKGGRYARAPAVGAIACAVIVWGLAQRPYLLLTSMTVAEGAGASSTLTWPAFVTLVALVIVVPAVVFLYWLDSRGDLEELTEADLRQGGDPRDGDRPDTA